MKDMVKRPAMDFLNQVLNVHVIIDVISSVFLYGVYVLTQQLNKLSVYYYICLVDAIIPAYQISRGFKKHATALQLTVFLKNQTT